MTATATSTGLDFAEVYAQQLTPIWRFVRARVPEPDAHDVTADTFVRAWRSWHRFDAARPVEPWLFTIARRAIADHHRRPDREAPVAPASLRQNPTMASDDSPEAVLLREELLAQLASALGGLSPREREGLALRFAARLSMAHVAEVLGTTVGAAKMLVHRAVRRLGEQIDEAAPADSTADLEVVIDDVLARGHESLSDSALHGLLVHLAAVHETPTPEGLGSKVSECVACATVEDDADQNQHSTGGGTGRASAMLAALTATASACLVCTVPALWTVFAALGLLSLGITVHYVGLAAVPFVLYVIWRGTRRHGFDRGYRWAKLGAYAIGAHALMHVAFEATVGTSLPPWVEAVMAASFMGSDWLGTGLLLFGAALNIKDLAAWRRAQSQEFSRALAV